MYDDITFNASDMSVLYVDLWSDPISVPHNIMASGLWLGYLSTLSKCSSKKIALFVFIGTVYSCITLYVGQMNTIGLNLVFLFRQSKNTMSVERTSESYILLDWSMCMCQNYFTVKTANFSNMLHWLQDVVSYVSPNHWFVCPREQQIVLVSGIP